MSELVLCGVVKTAAGMLEDIYFVTDLQDGTELVYRDDPHSPKGIMLDELDVKGIEKTSTVTDGDGTHFVYTDEYRHLASLLITNKVHNGAVGIVALENDKILVITNDSLFEGYFSSMEINSTEKEEYAGTSDVVDLDSDDFEHDLLYNI